MLGSSVCANRGNSGIEPDSEQRLKILKRYKPKESRVSAI